MDPIYSKILDYIAAKNHVDASGATQFQSGRVNKVFDLNNGLVVKIQGDQEAYGTDLFKHQPENVNALVSKGAKVPKILDHGIAEGKNYLLMEKVKGKNLIHSWTAFSSKQKENFIAQIAEQLQIFHSIPSDKYFYIFDDFAEGVQSDFDFSKINKEALKPEYAASIELLENYCHENIHLADESEPPVLLHNDLHFENAYYENNEITGIIDFDYATYGPKDYELKKLIDFAHTPASYVDESLESKYKGVQLTEELVMLKKHYPAMFAVENFYGRVKLYLIGELVWIIEGYQMGRWSNNAMGTIQQKVEDWYKKQWLEELLS